MRQTYEKLFDYAPLSPFRTCEVNRERVRLKSRHIATKCGLCFARGCVERKPNYQFANLK